MIIIVALLLLAAAASVSADCQACIDSICYDRTSLIKGYQPNGQLAIDRTSNLLYFHFQNFNYVDFNAVFNLDDLNYQLIPNVRFTFARAVDQTTRDVYMSANKGIYKYNPTTNLTEHYGLADKRIWLLQYKNKIYYVEDISKGLYTFENGVSNGISALSKYQIYDFIVDKNDDIYFVSDFTVYKLRNGDEEVTKVSDETFTLTTDKHLNAYFICSSTRGIYKMDYKNNSLIDVGAFCKGRPFHTVFDKDNNVIYHDVDTEQIFYLTPNYGRCRVTSSGSGKKTVSSNAGNMMNGWTDTEGTK